MSYLGDDASTGEQLIEEIMDLRREALESEAHRREAIEAAAPAYQESARNLAHYLALRQQDIREVQKGLAECGLSSLGRAEAHVMANLDAVAHALHRVFDRELPGEFDEQRRLSFEKGDRLLDEHAAEILGPEPGDRRCRIMVTMPSSAADDPGLIEELVRSGMNVMRINCAHDGPDAWAAMVDHLRAAEERTGRRCRIMCDLGGPKLRTGAIEPGPEVVRWRPARNALGHAVVPAFVVFTDAHDAIDVSSVVIPAGGALLEAAQPGDEIRLTDTRGRERSLPVIESGPHRCLCQCDRTGYVTTGTDLELWREGRKIVSDRVGALPARPEAIELSRGDTLILTSDDVPGRGAVDDGDDTVLEPAHIGCSMPEVFRDAQVGQRIFFDDGKLGGIIRSVARDAIRVEITHAAGGSAKLRAEKGINLPDTELNISALTEDDLGHLPFVEKHADAVALSFVRRPADVDRLIAELNRLNAGDVGIVLKIENRPAFENLPDLLLAAMKRPPLAVMVARGDLGVEIGFERMAEVQEEMLWLCEAAHVPVIWATQVLESLAKKGLPSRAEVTDAAMSGRAEAVMLNKGPHIVEAVRFLSDVLQRMQEHQSKKSATLRRLRVAS